MSKTLIEILDEYKNSGNISFAMPGHKGGRGIKKLLRENFFALDVTELEETESLHEPKECLRESLEKTAKFFGADESYMLVNGSTSGIFTMLMACCNRGDKVIINRGCHVSAINACIVLGLNPIFAEERIIKDFNVSAACGRDEIEKLLAENDISAILVTSPTYYGFTADLTEIARLAHEHGVPLLVDEAHGAHFAANKKIFPKTALESGADMCVQSAHKTLNSANQTAFLHVRSNIADRERIKKSFSFFQTTSPSYPLLASAELARIELEESGEKKWGRVWRKCKQIRKKLVGVALSPNRALREKYGFSDIDECRLVINVSEKDISGIELADILRKKYKIDVEMADIYQVVLIPTPSNTDSDFEILENALFEVLSGIPKKKGAKEEFALSKHVYKMTLNEAFNKKGEYRKICDCDGKIAKGAVVPYPPGIAALVPGELITKETISILFGLLEKCADIQGISDEMIEVIAKE